MANPRVQGVQWNGDRAFLTVYPPAAPPQRIYLKCRRDDSGIATLIARACAAPLQAGDAATVQSRVRQFAAVRRRYPLPDGASSYSPDADLRRAATRRLIALSALHDAFLREDDPTIEQKEQEWINSHDWETGHEILNEDFKPCPHCDKPLALCDDTEAILTSFIRRKDFNTIRQYALRAMEILYIHERKDELKTIYEVLLKALGLRKRHIDASETLSDVLRAYHEIETPTFRRKGLLPRDNRYYREKESRYNDWVKWIGKDLPVNRIEKFHLTGYEEYIRNKRATLSAKRRNDCIQPVKQILRTVLRKRKDKATGKFLFPDELREWLDAIDAEHYRPPKANGKPMPVDVFHQLLAKAEDIAKADPKKLAAIRLASKPPKAPKNPKRKPPHDWQAIRTAQQTIGMMQRLAIMLRLAVQCGYGPRDLCRLQIEHLHLDGGIPYIDFEREKTTETHGEPAPRKMPLLPSVANALKEYIGDRTTGYVFLNDKGNHYNDEGNDISHAFKKLMKAAQIDHWTIKFARNVIENVGHKYKISGDEIELALGHIPTTTRGRYYRDYDAIDGAHAINLANAIGRDYFGGEQVITPPDNGA